MKRNELEEIGMNRMHLKNRKSSSWWNSIWQLVSKEFVEWR